MILPSIAGTSFLLGLSGAVMPGPLLTVTIDESLRRGPLAGPLLIAGHAALEALVVLILFAGAASYIQQPPIFAAVALIGGGVLMWMARGMLRGLPSLRLDLTPSGRHRMHPLIAGALVSLANPYFTLWWATVGMGYLLVANEAGIAGIVVFYVFHILADLVWYAFIAQSVCIGRRLLTDTGYRRLVGGCAVFLVGFGLFFVYRGLATLFA
ncbi:MAG: LysE family transporter [Desulfuromonadales bacterium]|nr:LysE family transporter [Desulfuromonadales bacterium]NIR33089.1 LysE family transporter [Desulfuromonadales bacterium]NIS41868.1 LysE family transporter [Desulfuromonadales bacterium]